MKIDSFQGEYRWLSNFWLVPVELDGKTYKSVEHAYMAAKTLDPVLRETIRCFATPGQAKKFCKTIKLRDDWEAVKLRVMHNLLVQKFFHQGLRAKLIATGNAELIEGNTWGDTYWGVCRGVGQNQLGRLLMQIRDGLTNTPADWNF